MCARKKNTIPTSTPPPKPVAAETRVNTANPELMHEIMVWICTIVCSIIVFAVIATIIRAVYKPDVSPMYARAKELLIMSEIVSPEPVESLLTKLGVVVIGLGLLGFYMLFSRWKALKAVVNKQLFTAVTSVCAAALLVLIFVDFSAPNPFSKALTGGQQNQRDLVGISNFDFFFDGLFLGNYLWVYMLVCIPLLCALFFIGFRKKNWDQAAIYKYLANGVGYGLSAAILFVVIAMNSFHFPYTFENKFDFEAVYYCMTQVYAGSPMLVDGFTNTYGLYPHFLNPLFQVIGLSVLKFSTLMAILVAVSFSLNFYFLKQYTSNKVILFLGFFTILFFPYLDARITINFDAFFALFPIRYIIPSLLLVLASAYVQKRTKKLYWLTMLVIATGVLWNPEIGLVSFLAWIAMNVYTDFYDSEGRPAYAAMLRHVLSGIGMLAAVTLVYIGVIYLGYGVFPDLSLLFATMALFAQIGFNLLPMAVVHPWHLMVLVLVFGFVYAISKLYRKAVTPRASMIFLLSVIGVGFFFYFQGRSHNWSFSSVSGFSIMLLVLLGDELWEKTRQNNSLPLYMLFAVFLFTISFSVFELLYSSDVLSKLVFQDEVKESQLKEQRLVERNTEFINQNSAEKEKILVLTTKPKFGLYFDGHKRVSAFNPSFTELFFQAGVRRLEETIVNGPPKVFIDAYECRFTYMRPAMLAISALYEVQALDENIGFLRRRTNNMPGKTFFGDTAGAAFHRKYTNDQEGLNARIKDAIGEKPVTLDSSFAVQVLFYSTPQLCPTAALIANMKDTAGFIMEKRSMTNKYYFGFNKMGMETQFVDNRWIYCVMNVYPNRIEVYANGRKLGTTELKSPYQQSREPIHVGSQEIGSVAYYVGSIAEAAIVNHCLSEGEIEAIWGDIRRSLVR